MEQSNKFQQIIRERITTHNKRFAQKSEELSQLHRDWDTTKNKLKKEEDLLVEIEHEDVSSNAFEFALEEYAKHHTKDEERRGH